MTTIAKRVILGACAVATVLTGNVRAQQPAPAPQKLVSYKVEVVLTRLNGDKVLGTSPYAVSVNSVNKFSSRASLRIGVEVPSGTVTNQGSGRTETAFKTVGTQIDCSVTPFDDQRYAVELSINDTAIFDGAAADRLAQAERISQQANQKLERQKELASRNLATRASLADAQTAAQIAEAELTALRSGTRPLGRADQMAFRSFTSSNVVYLRDGESQEMTVATDRTSGETIKAAVKLTVVK